MLQNLRKELNAWLTTILIRNKAVFLLFYYIPLNFFPASFAGVFQETINLLHRLESYHCVVQARNGIKDSLK